MFKITQEFLNKNYGWILRIGSIDYLIQQYLDENPPEAAPSHTIEGQIDFSSNNISYTGNYYLRTLDENNQTLDLYIYADINSEAIFSENIIIDLSEIPGIYPMNNMEGFNLTGTGISGQGNPILIRYLIDPTGIVSARNLLIEEADTGSVYVSISIPISKDFT